MLSFGLMSGAASAGPPFRTDDPEPVDYQHWEFYTFTTGTHVGGDTTGALPAVEFNYGILPNTQFHIIVPVAFNSPLGGPTIFGSGDVELGLKYRFVEQDPNSELPAVGTFPLIEVPSGSQSRGLGAGHVSVFLPIWVQKDFGDWTTYGGGGYWLNKSVEYRSKDYCFFGWLLQRKINKEFSVGGEIFYQTASAVGGADRVGFNFGAIYDIDAHNHFLVSVGREFLYGHKTSQYSWYVGWQITY
ncbi:transporter [Methylobacterium sp. P31]